ncbi:MAG: hypothetical protein WCP18_00795 [bacterium]
MPLDYVKKNRSNDINDTQISQAFVKADWSEKDTAKTLENIDSHAKKLNLLLIGGLVVILVIAFGFLEIFAPLFNKVGQPPLAININKNNELTTQQFQEKYGLSESLIIKSNFIKFTKGELVVCDINGNTVKVLKEYKPINSAANSSVSTSSSSAEMMTFPSPLGSFYIGETGMANYSRTRKVYGIDGKYLFSINYRYGKVLKWSPSEKFLAVLDNTNLQYGLVDVVVYSTALAKEVFRFPLRIPYGGTSRYGESNADFAWSDRNDTLYVSEANNSIYIFNNFGGDLSERSVYIEEPCNSLAVRGNEIYCTKKMGTIYSGTANTTGTDKNGDIIKYILTDNHELAPPQDLTPERLDGEYNASISFIDNSHLLFVPLLGLNTIINVDTGKIAELSSIGRTTVDHSEEAKLFADLQGNDEMPIIRYLGDGNDVINLQSETSVISNKYNVISPSIDNYPVMNQETSKIEIEKVKSIMNEIKQGHLTGNSSLIKAHFSTTTLRDYSLGEDSKGNLLKDDSVTINSIDWQGAGITAKFTTIYKGQVMNEEWDFFKIDGDWKYDINETEQRLNKKYVNAKKSLGDPNGYVDFKVDIGSFGSHLLVNNGKDTDVRVDITNVGTKTADYTPLLVIFMSGYDAGDPYIWYPDIFGFINGKFFPLAPGEKRIFYFRPYRDSANREMKDTPGIKTVTAIVNEDRGIKESNYSNNITTTSVQMYSN